MLGLFKAIRILMLLSLCLATQASTSVRPPSNQNPFANSRPLPNPGGAPKQPGTTTSRIQSVTNPITQSQVSKAPTNALEACKTESGKSRILVLSIDGASVRGIAQFELLLALEERVNETLAKEAQKASKGEKFKYERISITDMFDFFAGTSAGSVNVGALLIPADYSLTNTPGHVNKPKFNATELKTMLPDTLRAAFSSSLWRKFRTLQIPGVGGLLGSKFTATPFEQLLQELGGKARMSDMVKPAVITSYDLRTREIMNFSTQDACAIGKEDVVKFQPQSNRDFSRKDKNVFIWEAVRASSAAPVYYKPLELDIGGKQRALIDAGLFVMSPTLLAWVEAQKIYPGRPLTIISISSGTLNEIREVQTKGSTAGSIPKVLQPTIETALEGQQALTDLMMKDIPGIQYHRLSFEVKNKVFDDASPENIKMLQEAAKVTMATREFEYAVRDIVAAILERREKLKENPKDFAPYVCTAKEEFKKNMNLSLKPEGPSSDKKKEDIKKAMDKILKATGEMGTENDQGKRVVEFSDSKQDQELKASATKAKQNCQILLGQSKTQTPDWKSGNCDKVLDQKDICKGLSLKKNEIESDYSNNGCKKLSLKKPQACKNLSALMKDNAQGLTDRKCPKVAGG